MQHLSFHTEEAMLQRIERRLMVKTHPGSIPATNKCFFLLFGHKVVGETLLINIIHEKVALRLTNKKPYKSLFHLQPRLVTG